MISLNKAQLFGRTGGKPELRQTKDGASVANFSVATSERYSDKSGKTQETTDWHQVTVWGKLAEACVEYIDKGDTVYVEGSIKTKEWEDRAGNTRYSTYLKAARVQF